MIRLSALSALLLLAACSASAPADSDLDALSQAFLRARTEVPAFGGVALDGDQPVVFTIGEAPDAAPAVLALFGAESGADVRARPARGNGSEGLKDEVSRVVLGTVRDAQSVDYDETTGYVRVGVLNAEAVRASHAAMERAGLPVSEILVHVEGRIQTLPL